ncbi:MAG TPA: ATP-binding cassette domain-containing protein [Sporichthyaceae bacterium]|nr:ATP-binding cassette domain-containing protein [Sporichthyaceae bacterium]
MNAVEVSGLGVRLGGYPVFKDVNLSVAPGEIVAVLGGIGSGKTTLLRVLGGQIEPGAGTVRVLGRTPTAAMDSGEVVLVCGEPAWEPGANVLQVLELARMAGEGVLDDTWPIPPRVMEAFELDNRYDELPGTLSQGLRQRLALATAFCRPSSLLLVDDPEFGLDDRFRPLLADILRGYADRGGTAVLGTHDLDLAVGAQARTFALD